MKAFPVKIPTLWRQAFPGLVLGAIAARITLWAKGDSFSFPNTLPLMAIAAVFVVLLYYLQPTLAGKEGIKAMTSWGVRRMVSWADITSVSFGRLYFIQPSLRVVDRSGKVYWIARDTKDLGGLYALTLEHAGSSHPMARALQTPLHAL